MRAYLVVTGSCGHFGRHLVEQLSDSYNIIALSHTTRQTFKNSIFPVIADLGTSQGRSFAFNQITRILAADNQSALFGIVNNAYWTSLSDVTTARGDCYEGVYRAHLDFTLCLLPLLSINSSVVSISSIYAHVAPKASNYPKGFTVNPLEYGAMKAAFESSTRWLSSMYSQRLGIRFNNVAFGAFPSPCNSSPEFLQKLAENTHLGRIGRPEEVVGPVRFLLSNDSSYVTGTTIHVDGGWTSW
jgi:NAD(P)-dependent dehydrogenase (short-subunit alcohol dehydrogenase family)